MSEMKGTEVLGLVKVLLCQVVLATLITTRIYCLRQTFLIHSKYNIVTGFER